MIRRDGGAAPTGSAGPEPTRPRRTEALATDPVSRAGQLPGAHQLAAAGLIGLQRSAGNAAVGALLAAAKRPRDTRAGPVQRIGLGDLADTADAVSARATAAVGSVAGAGTLAGLSSAFDQARTTVDSAEANAHAAGSAQQQQTTGQLTGHAQQVKSELDAVCAVSEREAAAETDSAGQRGQAVEQAAQALEQRGTQAGTLLGSVNPVLGDLVSPVAAVVEPGRVGHAGAVLDQVSSTATAGTGPGALGSDAAGTATGTLGAVATPVWDCDLAEVIANAGGVDKCAVADTVNAGERMSGAARLANIGGFASQLRQRIGTVSAALNDGLSRLAGAANGAFRAQNAPLQAAADGAAEQLAAGSGEIRSRTNTAVVNARTGYLRGWAATTDGAAGSLRGLVGTVGSRIAGAAGTLGKLASAIGSAIGLPPAFTSFMQGLPTRAENSRTFLAGVGTTLAGIAGSIRDQALRSMNNLLDTTLRALVAAHQRAQSFVEGARRAARDALARVGKAIGDWRGGVIRDLLRRANRSAKGVEDGADKVIATVRDGACVRLGGVAGPCLTQHLPDLGGEINNTVRLVTRGDVILPLGEFGVPGNLKIAGGAAVEVSAKAGFYSLRVDGRAQLLFNETYGQDAHAGADLAPLSGTSLAQAWQALGSGTASPATAASSPVAAVGAGVAGLAPAAGAAPGGGVAGLAPALGGGKDVELNAGLQGSTESLWQFDATKAATTCDGVGGLAALMALFGVAGALPAPFNAAGTAAVYRGFMDQLQYSRFSTGVGAEVSSDLKSEGAAKFTGRVGADVSENISTVRDAVSGELVTSRTRTITGELDTSARTQLTAGSLGSFNTFLNGEGIVRLTLAYQQPPSEAIVPTAVGGAIKVSLGVRNFDPAALLAALTPFLPDSTGPIESAIRGGLPGMDGPREVALALTVGRTYTGLEVVSQALTEYFTTAPATVTAAGAIKVVKEQLATIQPVDLVKVELSQTQRRRLDLGGKEGKGLAAGADVDLAAEHTISRIWQNFRGPEAVIEAAGKQTKVVPSVVEPEKKTPQPGKHQAPTGTYEDPILFIWAKPAHRYAVVVLDGPNGRERYSSQVPKALPPPDQDKTIGVPGFWGHLQTRPFEKGPGTPSPRRAEVEFKKLLEKHGFGRDGEDGWDDNSPDHVKDLAWTGADDRSNLWPLDRETNRKAGEYHSYRQIVECNFPDDPPEQPPRRLPLSHPYFKVPGVFFRIREVADPP